MMIHTEGRDGQQLSVATEEPPGCREDGFRDFAESMLQSIDEVFFWCDAGSLKPYYVSPAYERIWGRACESAYVDPSSWIESIHEEDRGYVLTELERAATQGHIQVEYRIKLPDGTIRWIWARTFPVRNKRGAVIRLVGIAQDCTERRQAEGTRAFLASIVESSDDAIVGTVLDGGILSWNRAAEQLFGYSAEEAIGQSVIMLFPPDRKADYLSTLTKVRRQERVERFEAIRVGKDGRPIDILAIISPIRDPLGKLQGVSAIYGDIGDRKRAEREREDMELQLRHAQKLQSIGRLASGVAHEINTPAQFIGDNLQFLKKAFLDLEQLFRLYQALLAVAHENDVTKKTAEDVLAFAQRI